MKAQPQIGSQPKWGDFGHEKDQGKAYLTANEKWQNANKGRLAPYPRPTAHPYVEASVTEADGKFVADFEIINDDPTDAQVLRDKKNQLLDKIAYAERMAIDAVLPPLGKRRLFNLQEADINAADAAMAQTIHEQTPESSRATLNVMAEVEKRRDPLSTKHLQEQAACRAKANQIMRNAAQAMSEVEDLTLDNIDHYQMPNLG
ncbi:hypothetical protein [Bradyrhizobium erythrophlei]|uniref:hypothetical protein n=1 Tax=Bradyrhizobium erythrophlei TaxID=1437360 RepID=UPI0012EB657C|nr:hypothetical protein [Bradyrhizobium erythrophlei]